MPMRSLESRHGLALRMFPLLLAACQPQAAGSGPAELRIQPDLVIASEEDVPQSFADVRGVVVDQEGRIYVLEASVPEVRVFDRAGGFIRRIGRRGRGPGEFVYANGLAFTPAGDLLVYDPRADRVTVFDTAGGLVATHPLMMTSFGYLWQGGLDSNGRVLDRQRARVDTSFTPVIRRFDPATGRSDTLAMPECRVAGAPNYSFPQGFMGVPYAAGAYTLLEPAGWVWCANTSAALAWRIPLEGGAATDTFTSAAVPAPVSPAERDSAIASVEKFKETAGPAELDYGLIPALKPVLEAVDLDREGRVWMRVRDSAGPAIHLFAPDRRWVARIRHDLHLSPWHQLAIRGDTVVAVARDSLDVPMIVRFVVPVDDVTQ